MKSRAGIAILLSTILSAQAPTRPGTIRGHIVDAAGARIPRAHIFVHAASGEDTVQFGTVSDQEGDFVLTLPPGGYDIFVTSPAFEATVQSIGVISGKTVKTHWRLKVHSCDFPTMNCDTFH